ncbi:excinuclease ABC subunit UvrC [Phototrophicus methaneseepsis]|uniref:UvrABC system protein C n=1 Tax=Phototrophicus methaneseepsis TaxID=2710758 RepID=A0A7S8E7T1_9CHLR|nr:excinuclease ABC subunit UvrC [Phototrophicus methaneseepsis]QPC81937.1 excinuclease ABC subunit UvrC [Phototrophicus methaneseepsis]
MPFQPSDHIRTILDNLPMKPGVYIMKNDKGKIIYIGKAKYLRHRVRSYFTANADGTRKTLKMRAQVRDIDYIIAESEVKALILEDTLIKKHKPRYNIMLKDDKRYPYIRISWQEDYPKVETTRRVENDGARYFGPYAAMWAVQNTLRVLRKAFPYLTCDRDITGQDERACLFYDLKLCNAPCIGAVNRDEYRAMIQELMDVLSGKSEGVLGRLEEEMMGASEDLNFEKAAAIRDQIKAIHFITTRHKAVSPKMTDHDVIAIARENDDAVVQILFIRNGKLIGSDSRVLDNADEETDESILEQFIPQFYSEMADVPRELILPSEIEEARILERWLRDKRHGSKVEITVPQRGNKRSLIQLAQENANDALRMMRAQYEADVTKQETSLTELQTEMSLPRIPNRIECFDISTTQGTAITASRVVFVQGVPRKSEYRRFNIRTVDHFGSDDYQSMREALTRRFNRWQNAQLEDTGITTPDGKDKNETWKLLPDLLLIDGGKGQLGIAVEVLKEFDLFGKVPVAGLAKQFEELYIPGESKPIVLPRRSPALYLVQRVRDEAHRFAITSHRNRRSKAGMVSQLESIPGIGPKKRKALLKHFGNSIDRIKKASADELMQVAGINEKLAETIIIGLD